MGRFLVASVGRMGPWHCKARLKRGWEMDASCNISVSAFPGRAVAILALDICKAIDFATLPRLILHFAPRINRRSWPNRVRRHASRERCIRSLAFRLRRLRPGSIGTLGQGWQGGAR